MVKVQSFEKAIKVFAAPKSGATRFAEKPELVSIFDTGKLRYINNVVEYKPRKLITPEEVKGLFVDSEIDGGMLRNQMYRIKMRLFLRCFKGVKNFKLWLHSVDLSNTITKDDCLEIAHFMNMHNGKFANIWKGYSKTDMLPNIEKLALFTRSLRRIEKLDFYKNLDEKSWENCIDGIINKPQEVIRPLLEYKYDSRDINKSISAGNGSESIKQKINTITKFLNQQFTKHDLEVYRGEGRFDVFDSVVLGKGFTLKNALENITAKIETGKIGEKEIDEFITQTLKKAKVTQERFMSTAIDPEAIERYAQKVYWKINIPKNSKASLIESYNVERESEAEILVQRMSRLFIKNAKYDHLNKRWYIEADLKQDNIELRPF